MIKKYKNLDPMTRDFIYFASIQIGIIACVMIAAAKNVKNMKCN